MGSRCPSNTEIRKRDKMKGDNQDSAVRGRKTKKKTKKKIYKVEPNS